MVFFSGRSLRETSQARNAPMIIAHKETLSEVETELNRGRRRIFRVSGLMKTRFQWKRVNSPGWALRERRVSANCQTKESCTILAKGSSTMNSRIASRISDITIWGLRI